MEINSCRNTERLFFDARRSIAEAANKTAIEHNIDLELLDDEDSDEERTRYYEDKNSTYESTNWSENSSPRLGANGKSMIKASRTRNTTDVSQFIEGPKPFYNSVNKSYASNSGMKTLQGNSTAKKAPSARKYAQLTLPKEAVTFTHQTNWVHVGLYAS